MQPENLNHVVDKGGWAAGPWHQEPDRVDFRHAGFACLMLRDEHSGVWCGYVGVTATHPAYGQHCGDVDVEVHGGLTYGAACDGSHVCHVPAPGEPDDLFWLGFDCNHGGDIAPGMDARMQRYGRPELRFGGEAYRDLAYVRHEVESLADQLRAMHPSDVLVVPVVGAVGRAFALDGDV